MCKSKNEEKIANKIAQVFSDRYIVKRRISAAKDWNEDLQNIRLLAEKTPVLRNAMDIYI